MLRARPDPLFSSLLVTSARYNTGETLEGPF